VPSTVAALLGAARLEPGGSVPWGHPVPDTGSGVYLVALSPSPRELDCPFPHAPLSSLAFDDLIARCSRITLDGNPHPTGQQIAARIASYWLPDETVLYIGLAGQPLRTRVRQYYKTPLGAAKPHKGGWWLKTLSVIGDLHVHFARTTDFKDAEEAMLHAFAANVSDETLGAYPAGEPPMPFANLRDGDWRRRNHGIKGATAGDSVPQNRSTVAEPSRSSSITEKTGREPRQETQRPRSQRVTAADMEAGRIRIPRGAAKAHLPDARSQIAIALRGHTLAGCRWDPRYGPPERSGVIGIGKAAAYQLLTVGDVLAVRIAPNGTIEIT